MKEKSLDKWLGPLEGKDRKSGKREFGNFGKPRLFKRNISIKIADREYKYENVKINEQWVKVLGERTLHFLKKNKLEVNIWFNKKDKVAYVIVKEFGKYDYEVWSTCNTLRMSDTQLCRGCSIGIKLVKEEKGTIVIQGQFCHKKGYKWLGIKIPFEIKITSCKGVKKKKGKKRK